MKKNEEIRVYDIKDNHCFIGKYDPSSALLFNNNSAKTAGNDVYGGDLYRCTIDRKVPGWVAMGTLVQPHYNYTFDLTSDPLHVCKCPSDDLNCLNIYPTIRTVKVHPGQSFNMSIMAVGQLIENIFFWSSKCNLCHSIATKFNRSKSC